MLVIKLNQKQRISSYDRLRQEYKALQQVPGSILSVVSGDSGRLGLVDETPYTKYISDNDV